MSKFSEVVLPSPDKKRSANDLLPLVYTELRRLAAIQLASERTDHTLQPTALVHEAYMKLAATEPRWESPRHFYNTAAEAMRRILVDSARKRGATKRGGGHARHPLDPDTLVGISDTDEDLLDLHDALSAFAAVKPEIAELVNLRYFAGLTLKDAAEMVGFAPRTADAYWAYARGWLMEYLLRGERAAPDLAS